MQIFRFAVITKVYCLLSITEVDYIVFRLLVFQRFEDAYNAELEQGKVSPDTQFNYAWCLIRSDNKSDILKGVLLLQGNKSLCQNRTYRSLDKFQFQIIKESQL